MILLEVVQGGGFFVYAPLIIATISADTAECTCRDVQPCHFRDEGSGVKTLLMDAI